MPQIKSTVSRLSLAMKIWINPSTSEAREQRIAYQYKKEKLCAISPVITLSKISKTVKYTKDIIQGAINVYFTWIDLLCIRDGRKSSAQS